MKPLTYGSRPKEKEFENEKLGAFVFVFELTQFLTRVLIYFYISDGLICQIEITKNWKVLGGGVISFLSRSLNGYQCDQMTGYYFLIFGHFKDNKRCQ